MILTRRTITPGNELASPPQRTSNRPLPTGPVRDFSYDVASWYAKHRAELSSNGDPAFVDESARSV